MNYADRLKPNDYSVWYDGKQYKLMQPPEKVQASRYGKTVYALICTRTDYDRWCTLMFHSNEIHHIISTCCNRVWSSRYRITVQRMIG